MNLQELGQKWETDKATVHSYLPIYQTYFEKIREKPISLLEIGAGWSMFMWLEYFPNSVVHVIDHKFPDNLKPNNRLRLFEMKQEDEAELFRFRDLRFDIIIDDGSHESWHQLLTCHALWSCLNPGGLYFVEDVCAVDRIPYWHMMPGFQSHTLLKNGRTDDILVKMEKSK